MAIKVSSEMLSAIISSQPRKQKQKSMVLIQQHFDPKGVIHTAKSTIERVIRLPVRVKTEVLHRARLQTVKF